MPGPTCLWISARSLRAHDGFTWRLRNRHPYRGKRRRIVELDAAVANAQTQIAPQRIEIGRHRLRSPFVMQLRQHVHADRLVRRREHALDRPVLFVVAAGGEDAAHGVLQAHSIVRPLANLDIGVQGKHRAAPVSAAPGIGVVEPPVAGLRQALGHVAHHREPDFLGAEVAGLHPRDRFDIDGQSFRQPGVAILHVGQREMHHFVHHDPVALQIVDAGVAAERNPYRSTAIAPCRAAAYARSFDRHEQQSQRLDGKTAVIDRDGFRRSRDPFQNLCLRQGELAGAERDMNHAGGDVEIGLRHSVERIVGHAIASH